MNYQSLSLEELVRMASTHAGARQYMIDNIEHIFEHAQDKAELEIESLMDEWPDQAGFYDSGWKTGRKELLEELEGKYHEPLSEYCLSRFTPEEFWIELEALLADIKDDPE